MKTLSKNYRIVLSVLLLIGLMLGYMIPNYYLANKTENQAAIVQKQVQSDKLILNEIMKDLREVLLVSGKFAYEKASLEYQEKYKDRFAFFLYQNKSLELWTDNHIPFPNDQDQLSNESIKLLGAYKVLTSEYEFYDFCLVGVQIIKLKYPWQNAYLTNHMASYFRVSVHLDAHKTEGVPILDKEGKELFYVQLNKQLKTSKLLVFPFLFFVLALFVLSMVLKNILQSIQLKKPYLSLFIFIGAIFIWLLVHFLLEVPESVFNSLLFSTSLYANFWINQSLGHLFFLSLGLFIIVIYYYAYYKASRVSYIWIWVYLLFSALFFSAIVLLIRGLVFDSQISLNLHHLASLNIYSYVVILVIFIFQLSWFLLLDRWLGHFENHKKTELHIWIFVTLFGLISLLSFVFNYYHFWEIQMSFSLFVISIFYLKRRRSKTNRIAELLFYLIIIAFITSWYVNDLSHEKERHLRQTKAFSFNLDNDPFLEAAFLQKAEKLSTDNKIIEILKNREVEFADDSILSIVSKNYFPNFANDYNISLIYCDDNSLINIMPDNVEKPCFQYFQNRISKSQKIISEDTLYLVESSFQFHHYIGIISLAIDSINTSNIYVEFVSKDKPKELGLPAILEKSHSSHTGMLRNYSYAVYKKGVLIEWYGKYDYKLKLKDYRLHEYHDLFFEKDQFNHYIYAKNSESIIIISRESAGLLQQFASYAFIFLLYSFLVFLIYSFFFAKSMQSSLGSFQGRLQYSMIFLLLVSFILIGISSLYYIYYLNKNKNEDLLMEKAHSVLIELEHKLSGLNQIQVEDKVYVESLLIKFSEVFFTDITLYNKEGKLLASSRSEMFTAALLSDRMDANAFYQLNFLKNSFFIQDEKIGSQSYLSAYLPFRNQNNQSVAYLNLPYFAKQYDLEEEVSGFVVAFLNIYLLLLFVTILLTVLISRFLSKPILLIRDKMQHLDLQQKNEKIDWDKDDEIGGLVNEYNRMVDELTLSAQKLAITQRESAWREMAQQIAHEIKNPLTPMMLNVQYLQKAWDDGADDFGSLLSRITKGLKEQIEVMSNIAGQFSSFASIDKIQPELLNLNIILEDVLSIFRANDQIRFKTNMEGEDIIIMADKSQMIRIFNNIFKNAIQAIGNSNKGLINIELKNTDTHIKMSIGDNGCGIDNSELSNIFEPHFTTKSSGMGLGLALVKKMLENNNGTITVTSEKGIGSIFTLMIPRSMENKLN